MIVVYFLRRSTSPVPSYPAPHPLKKSPSLSSFPTTCVAFNAVLTFRACSSPPNTGQCALCASITLVSVSIDDRFGRRRLESGGVANPSNARSVAAAALAVTLRVEGPSFKATSGWSSKASEAELKGAEGGY